MKVVLPEPAMPMQTTATAGDDMMTGRLLVCDYVTRYVFASRRNVNLRCSYVYVNSENVVLKSLSRHLKKTCEVGVSRSVISDFQTFVLSTYTRYINGA